MSNRKTVAQQIEEAQAKIKQEQNALKVLQNKQKEQERKARNHRLCKRHGLIESLLPDTIHLTEEQFKIFLEQHIASNQGRVKLASLLEDGKTEEEPIGADIEQSIDEVAKVEENNGLSPAQETLPSTDQNSSSDKQGTGYNTNSSSKPASDNKHNHSNNNSQQNNGRKHTPHTGRNNNKKAG